MGEDEFVARYASDGNRNSELAFRQIYREVVEDLIAGVRSRIDDEDDEDRASYLADVAVAAIRYVREFTRGIVPHLARARQSKAEMELRGRIRDFVAADDRHAKEQAQRLASMPRSPEADLAEARRMTAVLRSLRRRNRRRPR